MTRIVVRNIIVVKKAVFAMLVLVMLGCDSEPKLFKKLNSSSSSIRFANTLEESDDFNILDYLYFYNGGGVAIGDINNDGLPDIYFSGNQVKNQLYLNKGNLEFEDITAIAGVEGKSDWNTGATMVDINSDGWLDIYVCAVVGIRGLDGHNELFINNGDNTFTESASKYGLDFDSYSSNAAYLDYDLDGDLDMYLLNHAVHTQYSFGHANLRNKRSYETGDKLLRNDNGKFTDVSEEAGIFGGINGYGLGVAVSDFNVDGYPDLYISNDFHEDDYYYINNQNGTFTEQSKSSFSHISRFSMGSDVADINHDGLPDIISLDMLPEDEKVLKSSEGDEDINTLSYRVNKFDYHYQFARNMLQVNLGDNQYAEQGLLSGVAATDWSWSALFADFNLDGEQDLFISNGIPRRPNNLDYIKFVSSEKVMEKLDETKLVDQKALALMPSGAAMNYIFSGSDTLAFLDKSSDWLPNEASFSTASALADLDNDGDLDIVINNVNGPASMYINQSKESNYLSISIDGPEVNQFGIGAKAVLYINGVPQMKELYTVRGFQASSDPKIHFGLGKDKKVDSLRISLPNYGSMVLHDIDANQTLKVSVEKNDVQRNASKKNNPLFMPVDGALGIDFTHVEDRYIDFDREKLMPFRISDRGPGVAIGDINNDGLNDVLFGGSKFKPITAYVQVDSGFSKYHLPQLSKDSVKEDVAIAIADFDGDQISDVILGSGGADFYNKMKPLLDGYFKGVKNGLVKAELPAYYENASCIRPCDFDQDGDLDIFIGSQSVSNSYGAIPNSVLLINDQREFNSYENDQLSKVGMVTDAVWSDFDKDGWMDLIIVGEWMQPTFFKNKEGNLVKEDLLVDDYTGLWQCVVPFDIDKDGDLDFVLGNWGLNSKFKANNEFPLMMYYGDLDSDERTESVVAMEKEGRYYPINGLDELASQMVGLRKKFKTYESFAGQEVEKVFGREALRKAKNLDAKVLASGYLRNESGKFEFIAFDYKMQRAPIMAALVHDFDNDDEVELLLGGNYFGVKPYHGRLGSFGGAIIEAVDSISYEKLGLDWLNKSIRSLNVVGYNEEKYLLVTFNNEKVQLYKMR